MVAGVPVTSVAIGVQMWELVRSGGPEPFHVVTKASYMNMLSLFHMVLTPECDYATAMNLTLVRLIALPRATWLVICWLVICWLVICCPCHPCCGDTQSDWERDSAGADCLSERQFSDAVFEIPGACADDIGCWLCVFLFLCAVSCCDCRHRCWECSRSVDTENSGWPRDDCFVFVCVCVCVSDIWCFDVGAYEYLDVLQLLLDCATAKDVDGSCHLRTLDGKGYKGWG